MGNRIKERRERDKEVERIINGIKKLDQRCMRLAREKECIALRDKPPEKKKVARINRKLGVA